MKNYPKSARILAADDVRDEIGGKHTLVGVFAGDDIIYPTAPASAPAGARPMLPSLALYCLFAGGEGDFNARFEFEAPTKGKIHSSAPLPVKKLPGSNLILIFKMANVGLPEDGLYTARVFLDDHEYGLSIRIAEQSANAPQAEKLAAQ